MTFAEMKSEVELRLGNLQSNDPFYSYIGTWINRASNEFILRVLSRSKMKTGLFPELDDGWITTATTAGTAYVGRPADCLFIHNVYSFDKETGADMDDDTLRYLAEITDRRSYLLRKRSSTSTAAYPRSWHRWGDRVYLDPVPRATKLTQLMVEGFGKESALSSNPDELIMDDIWHPGVVHYSTYLGAEALGDDAERDAALAACDRMIEQTLSIKGRETASNRAKMKIKGDPTGE
jgi:hypothetical protein